MLSIRTVGRRAFTRSATRLQLSKEDQLLQSVPSRSKEIQERLSSLQDKTRSLQLRQLDEIQLKQIEQEKPKISDFKVPIFNTFIFASTVCLLLQWVYISLEKEEVLKDYQQKVDILENDIQMLLDKQDEIKRQKNAKWFGWLWA